ncbi:MAG: DEAD/DEAH box helicase [bacterium]
MITFEEIGIDGPILKAIKELGFETPMPIQEKVIPQLMQENCRDIVGLAQTGTGKTAAFGLPIIEKVDTSLNKVQFLILSPTRELCLQICEDLTSYAKYKSEIKITAIFGGASIDKQIQKIQRGVHIISATPGRLLDLINRRVVDLSKVRTVILDEADEMLNMGFRDDLEAILRETPKTKNTLLFSATMPNEVLHIANSYMNNPLEISIGRKNVGAENIEHICYIVHAKDRYLALKRIVDFYPGIYGIVFCRTRKETQEVADQLMQDGYNADSLHGDLSQAQRDLVMNKFRIKHITILVATDVAARGIDVDSLTHIINYNLPDELEIYTHRSGRTGRAGKKGISIMIANLKEKGKIFQIEKQINKKFVFANVPVGKDICEKQLFHVIDRMEKVEVDYSQIDPYLPEIFRKLEWLDYEELVKKFVSVEFNRFLDYYKNAPDLNKPSEAKRTKGGRNDSDTGFTRFFINLGRTDDLKPTTLIGLINDFTGIRDIEIGEIEILQNYSFFEVDASYAETVATAFKDKMLKKRTINLEISESVRRGRSGSSDRRNSDRPVRRNSDRSDRRGSDRPERKSYDRSDRSSSDRPERKSYDRPERSSSDRPERKSYDRSDRSGSDRPVKRDYDRSERPKKDESSRDKFEKKPESRGSEGEFAKSFKKEDGDKPKRSFRDKKSSSRFDSPAKRKR